MCPQDKRQLYWRPNAVELMTLRLTLDISYTRVVRREFLCHGRMLPSPQRDKKMSILDGISQCWVLGSTCSVNWDAWGTIAATLVGVAAWRASRSAALAAQKATEIAKEQKDGSDRDRHLQGVVLSQMLWQEVADLVIRTDHVMHNLSAAIGVTDRPYIKNYARLVEVLAACQRPWFPVAESVESRLHLLERSHGSLIAQLMGDTRRLMSDAASLASRLHAPLYADSAEPFEANVVARASFDGDEVELHAMLEDVTRIKEKVSELANDFLPYVEVPKVPPRNSRSI